MLASSSRMGDDKLRAKIPWNTTPRRVPAWLGWIPDPITHTGIALR